MDGKKKIKSEILFKESLYAVGKLQYAKGKKPDVDCIFCEIIQDNPNVISLKLFQNEELMICLNLYPYNPGHLMIIPTRHVESFEDLTEDERNNLFRTTIQMQKLLRDTLSPTGFNVGYNEGIFSGASIKHIHIHVVPRYKSEIGFIDIIGQTKIVVQTADEIIKLLKSKISDYL